MVSLNLIVLSGNVGSVTYATTGVGVAAFSLLLAVDCKNDDTIWVRVNAYGGLAKRCYEKVGRGDYVVIHGELMERQKSNEKITFIEVRAHDIIFEPTIKKNNKSNGE